MPHVESENSSGLATALPPATILRRKPGTDRC
jgi:hypothetical protein